MNEASLYRDILQLAEVDLDGLENEGKYPAREERIGLGRPPSSSPIEDIRRMRPDSKKRTTRV